MKRLAVVFYISLLLGALFISCAGTQGKPEVTGAAMEITNGGEMSAPKELSARDYVEWIENGRNGVKVDKKIGKFSYSAMYKPSSYLALQELKTGKIDKATFSKVKGEYEDMQYFTFRISAEGQRTELLQVDLNSEKDYYNRIQYFSFKMQDDMKLIDGQDTLDCSLFHFERIYGLAPYATFVLGFPSRNEKNRKQEAKGHFAHNKTLLFQDKIFNTGNIYMTMEADNLNRIPELITN